MQTILTSVACLAGLATLAAAGCATMPDSAAAQPTTHVFELRVYHAHEGKLPALVARFGEHTDALFRRHNMKSIGYWLPAETPAAHNLLVYILEHPSREAAEKNWAAFQADPEWKQIKAESEVNGPLVDHIDRYFMEPTAFSALR